MNSNPQLKSNPLPPPVENCPIPTGSWITSCSDPYTKNNILYAKCKNEKGYPNNSKIVLSYCQPGTLTNNNGVLTCSTASRPGNCMGGNCPIPTGGPWLASCIDPHTTGNILYAKCKTKNGQYVNTSANLYYCQPNTLLNDNGNLRCTYGNSDCGIQNNCKISYGSWAEQCLFPHTSGNMLYATCRNKEGVWNGTQIDLSKCKPNTLSNNDGKLQCTSGTGFCTAQGNFIIS